MEGPMSKLFCRDFLEVGAQSIQNHLAVREMTAIIVDAKLLLNIISLAITDVGE